MNKRELKAKTIEMCVKLLKSIVPEEEQAKVNKHNITTLLPKVTYYRHQKTGAIHLGMSIKHVRKRLKNNPELTLDDLRKEYNFV